MAAASPTPIPGREPLVSIIIPAVDEANSIGKTIAAIDRNDVPFEVLVVDGGSADHTPEIATLAGARIIRSSRRQRAYQLNLGATHACGQVLLFLHADTILPRGALRLIVEALDDVKTVGGAFMRQYASRSLVLRATCCLARWRNQLIGWHLGDQAMFVRRASFFQLGGFRGVDRFEDLDFSRRLRKFGQTVTLRPRVTSSARRFERLGPGRTTIRDIGLTLHYLSFGLTTGSRQTTESLSDAANTKRTATIPTV